MKTVLLFSMMVLVLTGCKKDDPALPAGEVYPKLITFDNFSVNVPEDWDGEKLQGIDSKVGYISNNEDRLNFDYGWYSNDLSSLTETTHIREKIKIDGHEALIARPRKKGEGEIGLYVKLDDMVSFNLVGTSSNEQRILNIFKSVKFF